MARKILSGPATPVVIVDPTSRRILGGPATPIACVSDLRAGSTVAGVITVATAGGDYTSLKAAMDSITDSGPNTRYRIDVGPGVFAESNPIVCKPYVYVNGSGQNATRIEATNSNQDLFTSANFLVFEDISLANVSGTGWVFNITDDHSVVLKDSIIFRCANGIRLNNANAIFTATNVIILNLLALGDTMTCGCCVAAGEFLVDSGRVGEGSSITTVFSSDGANATLLIRDFISSETGITTMLSADNNGRVGANGCSWSAMTDGIVIQRGGTVSLSSSAIVFAQQDGLRIENVGSASTFIGYGVLISESVRYDFNILSASAIVSGLGGARLDNVNFVTGAIISAGIIDLKEDDEGFNVIGEFHGGMPEKGAEAVFGEGDSYTRGMLVYTFNPSGSVWTDVSTEARSASGSTFTFPATAQNNAIYVASSLSDGTDVLKHYGIKLSQTVATVLGGGSIVVEYWDGGSWTEIDHMSVDANFVQYAKALFERTGSEQLRYPLAFLSGWTKNDPMTLGTNYYWIRYRVSSAVTTVPVFQQWKLHTNRFEVNANAISEYFGTGRYPKDLVVHLGLNDPVVGSAPANNSVSFTSNISLTITRNQFNDNQVHSFGEIIVIPAGLDTSIPITLEATWEPLTNNTGDVQHRLYTGQLEVGDLWDGSISDVLQTDVQTVPANDINVSRQVSFDIDVSDLVPGEFLVYKLERDATAPNDPPDTLAGNIAFGLVRAYGYFWRP